MFEYFNMEREAENMQNNTNGRINFPSIDMNYWFIIQPFAWNTFDSKTFSSSITANT